MGVKISPLSAALRLVSDPVTVIEDERFEPEVTLRPLVVANRSVPCVEVKVRLSEVLVASGSAISIASPFEVENVSEEFSLTVAAEGSVTVGGCVGDATDRPTDVEPARLSPGSLSEILSESEPTKFADGV